MANKQLANLGDLERAVLEYLWQEGAAEVKTVHAVIGQARGITHNTVQSTLKRLWKKELLTREKDGRAYVYAPAVDRETLTERSVGAVIDEVAGGEMGVALEAFVNLADEAGEETLDELEALIAERRGEQEE